jgi:hypothetical protein
VVIWNGSASNENDECRCACYGFRCRDRRAERWSDGCVTDPSGVSERDSVPVPCDHHSQGVTTGSFVFPPGTRLSVVGNLQDSAALGLGPFQFRFTGTFELRVLPASDVPSPESPTSEALMTRAPIVITGTPGVELLIENVP